MIALLFAVLAVFIILIFNEWWWRSLTSHGELNRKFVHITVGSFVAFWPYFLSWRQIQILSIAFIVVVTVSKYLNIFNAIHSVQRPTWGEFFFAAAVGLTTLVTHDNLIYAAALLQMSLADGLAAITGVRYGGRRRFLVFGRTKSFAGTLTFFVVSTAILWGFDLLGGSPYLGAGYLLFVSFTATLVEGMAVRGLDNLLVPLIVAALLVSH